MQFSKLAFYFAGLLILERKRTVRYVTIYRVCDVLTVTDLE